MTETTALDLLAKRVRHLETLEEIMSNIHGWDGSAWKKLPIVWGYSGQFTSHTETMNVAAGTHVLNFTPVPEGEVWVITSVAARVSTNNPSLVSLGIVTGEGFQRFIVRAYTVANDTVELPNQLVLVEDDYVRARFVGCLLNDDIYADVNGYKMLIAE